MALYKKTPHAKQSLDVIHTPISKESGFTLIEIIIGIVMLSISLAIVSSLIAPTEEQSADNLLQIKAAELGQSLLNDISSRAFADNSDMAGGRFRCNDAGQDACTEPLGPDGVDENSRANYNDVDDFHGYSEKKDVLGNDLDSTYNSFEIIVNVIYAGNELGLADNKLAKRITVTVTTPLGTEIRFATHKTNF